MDKCPVCGRQKFIDNKCEKCGSDLTPLLRLNELPDLYLNEGVRFLNEEKIDEAIEQLTTASSLQPNVSHPYILLGKTFLLKKQYKQAIIEFDKALQIEPGNEEAERLKRETEQASNKVKEAVINRSRRVNIFKALSIVIPVITFSIGITIFPLSQKLTKQKERSISLLAAEIEKRILNYPGMNLAHLNVAPSGRNIIITGDVPTSVHKSLLTEIARNTGLSHNVNVDQIIIAKRYIVKGEDTLSSISKRSYGSSWMWNKIFEANKKVIDNPNKLKKGQLLLIPIE